MPAMPDLWKLSSRFSAAGVGLLNGGLQEDEPVLHLTQGLRGEVQPTLHTGPRPLIKETMSQDFGQIATK